ncbi:helicase associated domain-containing protein [Rhodococcus sp. ACT016]|uniref:helicase associated domain-containing protein n=1 Tax=Rhodococcus sp. ACT016 TaxID=3134808 RepID=UPI003D2BE39B
MNDERDARSRAAVWANAIEHLEQFAAERGHLRIAAGYVCSDGMRLGAWVNSRRAERRRGTPTLTDERIAQLDNLGFVWDPPRGRTIDEFAEQWVAGIEHIEQYVTEQGHARVPSAWVCEDGFRLGRWASGRRSERRHNAPALTSDRIAQLDDLGFDWGTADTRPKRHSDQWDAGIDHLAQFIAEHGHARVPNGWTSTDGFHLGVWVTNKRADFHHGRPSLTSDRIDTLDTLGFHWGTAGTKTFPVVSRPPTQWDNAVHHLTQFVADHGHARVPQKWVSPDGFKLGAWAGRRRHERRAGTPTLTPERIAQLDNLGFEWEPPRGPRRAHSNP